MPYVYIICGDPKKGRRARKLIERERAFTENTIGFTAAYEEHSIIHPYGSTSLSENGASVLKPSASLCGSRLFLSSHPEAADPYWRIATLGGVLRLSDSYFAMTAFHCFLPDNANSHVIATSSYEGNDSGIDSEIVLKDVEHDSDANDFHGIKSKSSSDSASDSSGTACNDSSGPDQQFIHIFESSLFESVDACWKVRR